MKKLKFAIIAALILFPSIAFAQMDIITFINSEQPVASWTAEEKIAFLNDFVATGGYQETVTNEAGETVANPVTKKEFANRMIIKYIARCVNGWRKSVAEANIVIDSVELETP